MGGKTVLCKQVVSGVKGVCDDVTCPFYHSGVVQKGIVHSKKKICHYLLTFISLQTCMTFSSEEH